jgi:YVTN family beta-propeller protein
MAYGGVRDQVRKLALAACCAFVPLQDDNAVAVIDAKGEVIAHTPVAKGPAGIAASPDGRFVYVTHPEEGRVTVIDGRNFSVAHEWPFAGTPFGMAASPGGDRLVVSDWSRNVAVLLDARTGARLAETQVGQSPAGVAVDAATGRVYVANRESNTVSVLELEGLRPVASVPVGVAPFAVAVAPDGGRVIVANVRSADISVIDARTLTVTSFPSGGKSPYGVAVFASDRAAIVNQQSGKASFVDTNGGGVLAEVKVGLYPEGAALAPDGRSVWVANWFSGDVSVISLDNFRESRRIHVGRGPRYIAFTGAFAMYLRN